MRLPMEDPVEEFDFGESFDATLGLDYTSKTTNVSR